MVELFGLSMGTPFQGATLFAMLVALGIWWIRGMPERARVAADREANLLNERAEEMIGMRERLAAVESRLELKDRQLEAERTMYRHRIANLNQSFMALLMLLKKGVPVHDAVEEVERMRAEQLGREVAEAAMFRAAGLNFDSLDHGKSAAWQNADCAERDAQQTATSTKAARVEVERSEKDDE